MELLNRDEVIEALNAEIDFSIESDYDLTKIKPEFQKFADEMIKSQEKAINELEPVSDAVQVVRCKNCKHWKSKNNKIGYCRNMKFGHISKWIEIDICKKTKFDFFCAAGERPDIKEILEGLEDV